MKIAIQYLNDSSGNINAVQVPVAEWNKMVAKIRKYEQMLKIKSDLMEAFEEVEMLRRSKAKKQTLTDFLNEL